MNYIEREYVYDAYNTIYKRFDESRAYLWKSVKEFNSNISDGSIVVEVGSGNGKNLQNKNCYNIATDLCEKFLEITNKKGIDSLQLNNLSIPLKNNMADYVLSIAVIHHLTTEERRYKAVSEMIRILKPGGKMIIQVWAMKQPENSRRKFTEQDNYVSFKNAQKTIEKLRYYHVFNEGELNSILNKFNNIKILSSFWEVGNWIAIIEKFR